MSLMLVLSRTPGVAELTSLCRWLSSILHEVIVIEMESLMVSTRLGMKRTSNGTRMLDASTCLQWLNGANEDKSTLGRVS